MWPLSVFRNDKPETLKVSLTNWRCFQAPGVQKVDSAIDWINLYPVDSTNGFPNTHLLESDLFRGLQHLMFEKLRPDHFGIWSC